MYAMSLGGRRGAAVRAMVACAVVWEFWRCSAEGAQQVSVMFSIPDCCLLIGSIGIGACQSVGLAWSRVFRLTGNHKGCPYGEGRRFRVACRIDCGAVTFVRGNPSRAGLNLWGNVRMSIQEVIEQAQEYMRGNEVDGWLLYDYRGLNPIFADTVGSVGHVTRPVWLWIPASGRPRPAAEFR